MKIIKNILLFLILMLPLLLASCSAAAIKNDYQKMGLREYEGPSRVKTTRIVVNKKPTDHLMTTTCPNKQGERKIKVSKVGNTFVITVEEE